MSKRDVAIPVPVPEYVITTDGNQEESTVGHSSIAQVRDQMDLGSAAFTESSFLLNRENHTGLQSIDTVDGLVNIVTNVRPSVIQGIHSDFGTNDHFEYNHLIYGAEHKTITELWNIERDTAGTYTDAVGILRKIGPHLPRIEFNGNSGESEGVAVEEQRTNLLFHSEDFNNTYWNKARVNIGTGFTKAPDKTLTADKLLQQPTQTLMGGVYKSNVIATEHNTVSIFAKASEKDYLVIGTRASVENYTYFNLRTGEIDTIFPGHIARMVYYHDGWYRCSVYDRYIDSAFFYHADTNNSTTVTDSGGIFIWGAQLEAGRYRTSYIPTENAESTRTLDLISKELGDSFNQEHFTAYIDFIPDNTNDANYRYFYIGDGSDLNRLVLASTPSGSITLFFAVNGVVLNVTGAHVPAQRVKIGIRKSGKTISLFVNGLPQGTNTGLNDWSVGIDQLRIGLETPLRVGAGRFRRVDIYTNTLTDNELRSLTEI